MPRISVVAAAETILSAVLRAITAVAAGLLIVGGGLLLLWSMTPGEQPGDVSAIAMGAAAFAASHFMPVSIAGVEVTISPLLLTIISLTVIATAAGRARAVTGRVLEALHGAVFVITYAAAVMVGVALLAPTGTVSINFLAPGLVAAAGVVLALTLHATAWRQWWSRTASPWVRAGLRSGSMAVCGLVVAGAGFLTVGLLVSVGDMANIAELSGGTFGETAGVFLLSWLLLPNAIFAAIGYLSGAGFVIGAGSFAPLTVHSVELPAIPVLAAVPDGTARVAALCGIAALVAIAVMMTLNIRRTVSTVSARILAAVLGALMAGGSIALMTKLAGGGISQGAWQQTGAPALLTAAVVAGSLLVVALVWEAPTLIRHRPEPTARRSKTKSAKPKPAKPKPAKPETAEPASAKPTSAGPKTTSDDSGA